MKIIQHWSSFFLFNTKLICFRATLDDSKKEVINIWSFVGSRFTKKKSFPKVKIRAKIFFFFTPIDPPSWSQLRAQWVSLWLASVWVVLVGYGIEWKTKNMRKIWKQKQKHLKNAFRERIATRESSGDTLRAQYKLIAWNNCKQLNLRDSMITYCRAEDQMQ